MDESGFCGAHGPGAREKMRERGLKGGASTKRRWNQPALAEGELGPLESLDDCKRWLRITGEAVATSRLSDRQANAITKAISEWVKADGQVTAEQLAEIRALVSEAKKRAGLKVVR